MLAPTDVVARDLAVNTAVTNVQMWARSVDTEHFIRVPSAYSIRPSRFFCMSGAWRWKKHRAFSNWICPGNKWMVGEGLRWPNSNSSFPRFIIWVCWMPNDWRRYIHPANVCLSEFDRYLWSGAAGGARLRHAGRNVSVTGPIDVIGDSAAVRWTRICAWLVCAHCISSRWWRGRTRSVFMARLYRGICASSPAAASNRIGWSMPKSAWFDGWM